MQYYCKIMILTNLFGAVWDHTLLHICALTTDTNFLMSTFLSAAVVHCLHHSWIFTILLQCSRQIAKVLENSENGWGCGNLTNFLQRKIKRCQWRVSNFERSSSWQTDFFANIYCIFTSRKPLHFGLFVENRTEFYCTTVNHFY